MCSSRFCDVGVLGSPTAADGDTAGATDDGAREGRRLGTGIEYTDEGDGRGVAGRPVGPNTGADKVAMLANSDVALAPSDGADVEDPILHFTTNEV
jgi:hypothetical protein